MIIFNSEESVLGKKTPIPLMLVIDNEFHATFDTNIVSCWSKRLLEMQKFPEKK